MNELKNKNEITSLELVEQINIFRKQEGNRAELHHKTLLEIIRDEFSEEINEQKILPVEYKDKKGEKRPMYNLTYNQAKQILVRESKFVRKAVIQYIEKLENEIKRVSTKSTIDKNKRLEIMEKNANVRMSKQYLKLAEMTNDIRYKEALIALSTNIMSDKEILPLPKLEQKTYNAEEIGKILGISSNMVGRIANNYNLKTDRYGYLAQDKAKYCNKPVESFRYYEHAIDKFKEILNEEKIA